MAKRSSSLTATATRSGGHPAYSVHPAVTMVQNVIANMKDKTGRSLEEWIVLVKKNGPKDERAQRAWLKEKHQLGTNYAWWIAERANGKGEEDGDPKAYLRAAKEYVDEMYVGKKAGLRPIYDAVIDFALTLGEDLRICPCQTIVPLYRTHVFAQIRPATQKRIDLGFALRDCTKKLPNRILAAPGAQKSDRISHRIVLESADDFDDEAKRWLHTAYELNP